MAPGLCGPIELQSATQQSTNNHATANSTPSDHQTKTPSHESTGNPCLDFFNVLPNTPSQDLILRLNFAWQSAPLTTLKLMCNLRGVRGTGKNDKEGFYSSALWLHKNHPKTLANNVGLFARFGSLKDLLEILFRILEGSDSRVRMKEEWEKKKPEFFANRGLKRRLTCEDEKNAKALKVLKKAAKAKKALERYMHDPEYKFLYDNVCDVFADLLREDVKKLHGNDMSGISLAAKWCPSLDSSYDEYLLICESIAKRVFPKSEYPEYQGILEAHYSFKVRTRLRKEVLVPLRKALEIPEVYMCAKRWRDIPYERVASTAMNLGKKVFLKRDASGFEEYLEEVKDGENSIAAGAILPHEIIASLVNDRSPKLVEVAEFQWKRMVEDLGKTKGNGKFMNAIAVCNNKDSDVGVAFMLLVSELSMEPWKGRMVDLGGMSDEIVAIEGDTLVSKVDFIRSGNPFLMSSLPTVFDKILEDGVEKSLSEDQMIKRVFVFCDGEYDTTSAFCGRWEAEYTEIRRKFMEKGYQNAPEVVFWNVNSSQEVHLRRDQPGTAFVSGNSKNLLTLFMEEGGVMTPEAVMYAAISGPDYAKLVIHD